MENKLFCLQKGEYSTRSTLNVINKFEMNSCHGLLEWIVSALLQKPLVSHYWGSTLNGLL